MFWTLVVGLICVTDSFALDAEDNRPYDFQVILRVAPHRLLTPAFRRQLQSDLQDGVQAALGTLANVRVLDAATLPDDAWLDPASLGAPAPLNPTKRHFVDVSYAGGQYIVQARQLDGSTGLASPVPRQDRTADRAFVARLVTRCIDQDFGAVGTVVAKDGDRVWLQLRGGAIPGAHLARWVPVGSVFALARIEGDPARGRPVEAALLRTIGEPKDGRVECQFFYRYRDSRQRDPLDDWKNVECRALRLGTTAAPVRLRIVDADGLSMDLSLPVHVSQTGFKPTEVSEQGVARGGLFETRKSYDHVAFVRIDSVPPARIPVPVLDDRVVVCRVTASADGDARVVLELDARNLQQTFVDLARRLREQVRQLDKMTQAGQNREALTKVQANLEALDTQLGKLSGEVVRLRNESRQVTAEIGPALEICEACVKEIRKGRVLLVQTQEDLENAINVEDSPEARQKLESYQALLRRAALQYDRAEFDKAIETYQEILQRFDERPEIRKRLTDLQNAWEIKSEEHRRARTFAYGNWADTKSFEELRNLLPKARDAFERCRTVGDRLTVLKLFLVATDTATALVLQRSDELSHSQADEDKLFLKELQRVNEDLAALIKNMRAFVQEGDKDKN
jgi:tetratricopeptide (TPR) repeat protein